eukprot:COSAG02_NODE_34758_length_478_cov_1.965699_1_plen_31_part_10
MMIILQSSWFGARHGSLAIMVAAGARTRPAR